MKYSTVISFLALIFCYITPVEAKDYPLVVQVIAYESSGESFEGQLAVANTIKTRMKERKQTAEEVVTAPKQFSCIDPTTKRFTQIRQLTKKELESAGKAWNQSRVWQFNHYHALSVHPIWARQYKSRKVIGNHVFIQL